MYMSRYLISLSGCALGIIIILASINLYTSVETAKFVYKYIDNTSVNVIYNHETNCTIRHIFVNYDDAITYYNNVSVNNILVFTDDSLHDTYENNGTTYVLCEMINSDAVYAIYFCICLSSIITIISVICLCYTMHDHMRHCKLSQISFVNKESNNKSDIEIHTIN